MGEVDKKYEFGKLLGKGAFSLVYEVTDRSNGQKFAIKVINKSELGKEYEKNLKMEVDILKQVSHPNIIALKELFDTKDKLYLVMELVTGGELFDKIVEKGSYSETDAATIIRKIVSAVEYLHSMNIVHRDLKPENLLLKSAENDLEVALADFGLSKIVGSQTLMQTACGTPSYVAPEVLNATGYDREVDLWSIGVITYIILCGFPPFYGDSVNEIFEQIMDASYDYPAEYWTDVSASAKDFIDKLLVVDVTKRMTASHALEHPWLTKHDLSTSSLPKLSEKMKEYKVERQKTLSKLQG